ncbi:MAG: hypothetical protein GY803_15080 [Chloroflexi bacterium]|nr:hypothetical protein [Chloroflexota bacterium]
MKLWLKTVFVFILIVIVLTACVLLDEGEATRGIVVAGEETAVSPTRLPNTPTLTTTLIPTFTPAQTPVPTDVPLPTPSVTVIWTPEPTSTPWPIATPRPTIDFSVGVTWSDAIHLTQQFPGYQMEWSPARNDFVYIVEGEEGLDAINLARLPNFQPIDIMPTKLQFFSVGYLWHPTGDYFLMSAVRFEEGDLLSWKVTRTEPTVTELGYGSYFSGWLNDELLVSQRRVGTGWNGISIFDNVTGEVVSRTDFNGRVKGMSQNYVILTQELSQSYNTSAAILSSKVINPENTASEFGTHIEFLSLNHNGSRNITQPFSRFADIFSGTDHVLVVTWEEEVNHFLDLMSGSIPANLQVWDIENGTLIIVAPRGIYGRYSPDGNYLTFLTPGNDLPQLHLLAQPTNEPVFTQTAFAEPHYYYNAEIEAYITFSPDGRFLTFFNPAHELIIYNLENSEFLAPLTAVPTTPLWSPDGSRFVYENPDAGLSIFDTRNAAAYPLAVSGSDRLSEPQWSYDGTYLSVTVEQEEWWARETAVLQIP